MMPDKHGHEKSAAVLAATLPQCRLPDWLAAMAAQLQTGDAVSLEHLHARIHLAVARLGTLRAAIQGWQAKAGEFDKAPAWLLDAARDLRVARPEGVTATDGFDVARTMYAAETRQEEMAVIGLQVQALAERRRARAIARRGEQRTDQFLAGAKAWIDATTHEIVPPLRFALIAAGAAEQNDTGGDVPGHATPPDSLYETVRRAFIERKTLTMRELGIITNRPWTAGPGTPHGELVRCVTRLRHEGVVAKRYGGVGGYELIEPAP